MLKSKTEVRPGSPKGPLLAIKAYIARARKGSGCRRHNWDHQRLPSYTPVGLTRLGLGTVEHLSAVRNLTMRILRHIWIKISCIKQFARDFPLPLHQSPFCCRIFRNIFLYNITCQVIHKAKWAKVQHLLELLLNREEVLCCATIGQTSWTESVHKH